MRQTITKADLWNPDKYKDIRVLNVGCGSMTYGTDRFDLYASPTTTKIGNIEDGLPYDSDSFDEVYSRYNLEHLQNPGLFFREAARVLKPEGTLKVITNNAWFWRHPLGISKSYINDPHGPDDRHYAEYLPLHLQNYCDKSGLSVEAIGFMNCRRKIDKVLKAMGLEKMGAQNVFVIARKRLNTNLAKP